MGSLGVQTVFADQDERTATFTLTDVKTDRDRIELVTPGGGDTLDDCRNTSRYLYASQDRGYEFTIELAQWVYRPGDPVELQKLQLFIEPINPNARNDVGFPYIFRVDRLVNPPEPIEPGGSPTYYAARYDETRFVNGVTYTKVFEATWIDQSHPGPLEGNNPPPEANWQRVVVARNVGLVQFETADGRVFTRSAGQ